MNAPLLLVFDFSPVWWSATIQEHFTFFQAAAFKYLHHISLIIIFQIDFTFDRLSLSASSVDVPTRQAYSVICNRSEPVICLLVHRSPAMLCWNFSAPFAIFHHVNPFWDIALLAVLSAENTPVPSPLKVCHGGHCQIAWDCFMVCASNSTPFLFFFFFSSSTLIPIFFFLL